MAKVKIRKCDQGTEYAAALQSGADAGMAHASDAEVMAGFCESALQLLVGAVSPRLVWEGAQAKGLTSQDLLKIVHARDLDVLDELQFGERKPSIRVTSCCPAKPTSTTQLAGALAAADRMSHQIGGPTAPVYPAELAALRDLAEAVRAHLLAHPERG